MAIQTSINVVMALDLNGYSS